jgi:6-pyruvoyltetrahydropterin/6-carboxytetrahydropterin synthase
MMLESVQMFEITVEDHFSSGHYLRNYHGRCENPHGHNYRVCVTLVGNELQDNGLLLDFKQLKEIIQPIIDSLDHQMINEISPFTELNPSAENLARYFFDEIAGQVVKTTANRVTVKSCTVYETDRSSATYGR